MQNKIIFTIFILFFIINPSFAFELKEVFEKNIGHNISIALKNSGPGTPYGKILKVMDDYLITEMFGYTLYVKIDDIVCVSIENDATRAGK